MEYVNSDQQSYVLPRQRVSSSVKRTKKWQHANMYHWLRMSGVGVQTMDDYGRNLEKLYRAYNGHLHPDDYEHIVNPYNTQREAHKRFPARLRNYPIIRPVIEALLGDKLDRYADPQVFSKSAEVVEKIRAMAKDAVMEEFEQAAINAMNRIGIKTGVDTRELRSHSEITEKISQEQYDELAASGQDMIDYIIQQVRWLDTTQAMTRDAFVCGELYSYRDYSNGKVVYQPVSPMYLRCGVSSEEDFVCKGDYAVRMMHLTVNDLVDLLGDHLTDDQVAELENTNVVGNMPGVFMQPTPHMSYTGMNTNIALVPVRHVTWRSQRKVGTLYRENPLTGEPEVIEVDDTYIQSDGDIIEWEWRADQIWEGYEVAGKWFVGIDILVGHVDLPYNGRRTSGVHAEPISLVSIGLPFQILYNIVHYRLEFTLAKNKDKIVLMEKNVIPKDPGWDEEKFMYYADALGFAFIDTISKRGGDARHFNQYQVLDMSLSQQISAQFQLLAAIKQSFEDIAGVNRHVMGKMQAKDAVSNVQESLNRSSTIMSDLFRKIESVEDEDIRGMLWLSREVWRDGISTTFVDRSGTLRSVNLDGPLNVDDLEIYVPNRHEAMIKRRKLEAVMQQFAQNKADPLLIAELLDAKGFHTIKRLLKEEKEAAQRFEKEMERQKAEAQKAAQQAEFQKVEYDHDRIDAREKMKQDAETQRTAMIVSGNIATAKNGDTPVSPLEIAKAEIDAEDRDRSASQRDRELDIKEREMEMKDRQNLRDNYTALKNKVSGES